MAKAGAVSEVGSGGASKSWTGSEKRAGVWSKVLGCWFEGINDISMEFNRSLMEPLVEHSGASWILMGFELSSHRITEIFFHNVGPSLTKLAIENGSKKFQG